MPSRVVALVVIVSVCLAGCVTPATSRNDYAAKATSSLSAAESEVQTVRLTLEAALQARIFATTADETISGSEAALGSISSSFDAVQPPADSDDIRRLTSRVLDVANSAVTLARIAVRRHDAVMMQAALDHIRAASSRITRATERLT